jgi:uncharacterized phiE125 gp8 family phage protein
MMLIELTTVPAGALPVAEFRDHLRIGSGFTEEAAEDVFLQTLLRAALASVEARIGKALFERSFGLVFHAWRDLGTQVLPVAPVAAVSRIVRIDANGDETDAAPQTWRFVSDAHSPKVVATGVFLPSIPCDGSVRIEFTGGYGPDWSDIPADIALAVLMLAATYYEFRHEMGAGADIMPHGVTALLEPHRTLRLGGSRAAL